MVVILWSRIGTPLPAQCVTPEGGRYLSGTEWEYRGAVEGFRQRGRPSVWLYRRTESPRPAFDDPDFDEKREQVDARLLARNH